jgi:hypothetical protein
MVSAAIFSDFDGDGFVDLILTGEFMKIEFFKNINGQLKHYTDKLNFGQKMEGLWNSIIGADVNNDGKMDYVLGNLGLNTRYKASQNAPLRLFAKDFDNNGKVDIITTFEKEGKAYPIKQLNSYKSRINGLARKYNRVSDFADATFFDLFPKESYQNMLEYAAYESRSGILINLGDDQFIFEALPVEAQFSPIYGIYCEDFNDDGNLDIATIGNFHHAEIERGPYTASNGWIFIGDEKGKFKTMDHELQGFNLEGEGRALVPINIDGKLHLIASQNNNKALTFMHNGDYYLEEVPDGYRQAIIELKDGRKRKQEFYNGCGYLSNYKALVLKNNQVKNIIFKN